MSASGDWGSWAEDRERKYLVGLTVGVNERLAWLEEMLELALERGAIPKPRDGWGQTLQTGVRAASRSR